MSEKEMQIVNIYLLVNNDQIKLAGDFPTFMEDSPLSLLVKNEIF